MSKGGTLNIETSNFVHEGGEPSCGLGGNRRTEPVENGNYVRLLVQDSGIGMSEETMTHIFEPFYTTKDRGKGSGLGLPAVYGVIQQCGGSVIVESKDGEGSCFSVLIPGIEAPPKQIETPPESVETSPQGTVLVVEDDEELLGLASTILENEGYTVFSAASGQVALDEYSGRTVDLILSDVIMPEMAGPDFVNEWQKENAATPVLYMSGYIDESLEHYSIPESDIVTKPFTPVELLEQVSQALGRGTRT